MKPGTPQQIPCNIAIIGAGMAGLSAAQYLRNVGLNVSLFDKSRGPGGRMSSRRVDTLAFDHGAQYFTVRDPLFKRQVDSWMHDGIVGRWDGAIGVANSGVLEKKEDSQIRYVGTPRMSAITRHMANGLDVVYKTRVHQAGFSNQKWTLLDESQHNLGTFDALIITTPPEQAVPFLSLSPSLENKVKQIRMLPCWAVMAAFDEPIPIPFDGLFIHNNSLSWASRNNTRPGRHQSESWVLHGSPEWSKDHLELDGEEVRSLLLLAFSEATGIKFNQPLFSTAHRWRFALAESPSHDEYLWDKEKNLIVCGDWCNGSRVEGAFLSGIAAAKRIAELLDALPYIDPGIQRSLPGLK